MENKTIEDILKNSNIRVTKNRIAILSCLADEVHFHTVKEISKHVKDLNVKSIYNNIKILISEGLVDTYSFNGISKYAINDNFKDNHNAIHLVDNNSNVSHINISEKIINDIKNKVKKEGYNPSSVKIFVNIKK